MSENLRDIIDISGKVDVEQSTNFLTEETTDKVKDSSIPKEELERLTEDLIAAFKSVYDPEIPVDVYELGLIYKVDVSDVRDVVVDMTLTAPGCPVAGDMVMWVENAAASVAGVRGVIVNLIFEPPWTPDRMSDEARLELNMF
ncbi:MAG: iron-sulfur cluster assembly protein [Robiginitomaculum sp.]|nr:iron-sulfur cluster assembly protein [Robiginitomaculum sp.]